MLRAIEQASKRPMLPGLKGAANIGRPRPKVRKNRCSVIRSKMPALREEPLRKAVEDTLVYTRSAKAIRAEVARIPDDTVRTMERCIHKGDWKHPVFFQKESYSTLLKAYHQDVIDEDTFLSVQSLLQLYSQFGERTDLPLSHRLQGVVKRIDLSHPADRREQKEQTELFASLSVYFGLHENGTVTQCALLDTLKEMQGKGAALWVDVIELSEEDTETLKSLPERLSPEWAPHTQQEQILGWLKALHASSAPANIHIRAHDRKVYIFPRPILNELKKSMSASDIKFDPVFGVQTPDQVLEKRLNNKHVGALFHPKVGDRFRAPHDQQVGCITSLHDEYHEVLLSRMPEWMRQVYCHCDMYEQQLKALLSSADYSQPDVLAAFPSEFMEWFADNPMIALREKVLKTEGWAKSGDLTREELMEAFNETRPFLDQEFFTFPVDGANQDSQPFFGWLAATLFSLKSIQSVKWVVPKLALDSALLLKVNWILFRLAQDRPKDFLKVLIMLEEQGLDVSAWDGDKVIYREEDLLIVIRQLLEYYRPVAESVVPAA